MTTSRPRILWAAPAALLCLAGVGLAQSPPGVQWSTLFGGSDEDLLGSCRTAVAPDGDVLLGGHTLSLDLPTKRAYQSSYGGSGSYGGGDGFVARLDPTQTGDAQLIWCTYLGGSADEFLRAVVPDGNGGAFVCGWTESSDFPTTPGAYDETYNGARDAYVAHLAWDGQTLSLAWSTFLGAGGTDGASALTVDPTTGEVFLGGTTASFQFPIPAGTRPYQGALARLQDAFVAVFDPSALGVAQLLRSTYLGGVEQDILSSCTFDSAGLLVVSGRTKSVDFPTTSNAFDRSLGGVRDGFVSRLNPELSQLTYSTYLGGSDDEILKIMTIAPGDVIAVGGFTHSLDFPVTPNTFDPTYNGAQDAFLTLLDTQQPPVSQLVWSTYYGGSGLDYIKGLVVESCGRVTAGGETSSTDLPSTPGAWATSFVGGAMDTFVARFDPSAQGAAQLHHAAYLGGTLNDRAGLLTLDTSGTVIVVGMTDSPAFPTTQGAYRTTLSGGSDVFVAKLTMLPDGIARYGASTPACAWPIYQGVNSWPARGNRGFAVHACGAPAFAPGAFVLGLRSGPIPLFNATVWVNPVLAVPSPASARGHAKLGLPISSSAPLSGQVAAQWVFLTSGSCLGTGPLSASEGVELTIQ